MLTTLLLALASLTGPSFQFLDAADLVGRDGIGSTGAFGLTGDLTGLAGDLAGLAGFGKSMDDWERIVSGGVACIMGL
jgi:hypothetical protein